MRKIERKGGEISYYMIVIVNTSIIACAASK
jgi:hypothetical protein